MVKNGRQGAQRRGLRQALRCKAVRRSSRSGARKKVVISGLGRFSTNQAVAAFRARGRNITAQRMAVFQALERAEGHPTAEGLHGRIRRAVPGIALKTVYAILHELAEQI